MISTYLYLSITAMHVYVPIKNSDYRVCNNEIENTTIIKIQAFLLNLKYRIYTKFIFRIS